MPSIAGYPLRIAKRFHGHHRLWLQFICELHVLSEFCVHRARDTPADCTMRVQWKCFGCWANVLECIRNCLLWWVAQFTNTDTLSFNLPRRWGLAKPNKINIFNKSKVEFYFNNLQLSLNIVTHFTWDILTTRDGHGMGGPRAGPENRTNGPGRAEK